MLLPDVGTADERDAGRCLVADSDDRIALVVHLAPAVGEHIGDAGDHLVEEIAGAAPVQCTHGIRLADAEGEELPAVALAAVVVGLVGDEQRRAPGLAQPVGDRRVVVGDPDRAVDEEQHEICGAHGGLDLAAHLRIELGATRQPAAGVDEAELDAQPLPHELLAVAGDAGPVLHDRVLLADDPVEQGALADVGTADDDDRRQLDLWVQLGHASTFEIWGAMTPPGGRDRAPDSSAARRAMPLVAMTSTGRGSSSTRTPSRKTPPVRHTSGNR